MRNALILQQSQEGRAAGNAVHGWLRFIGPKGAGASASILPEAAVIRVATDGRCRKTKKSPDFCKAGPKSGRKRRLVAEPNLRCLEGYLRCPHFNFGLSNRTHGMVDDDRNQTLHADGGTG